MKKPLNAALMGSSVVEQITRKGDLISGRLPLVHYLRLRQPPIVERNGTEAGVLPSSGSDECSFYPTTITRGGKDFDPQLIGEERNTQTFRKWPLTLNRSQGRAAIGGLKPPRPTTLLPPTVGTSIGDQVGAMNVNERVVDLLSRRPAEFIRRCAAKLAAIREDCCRSLFRPSRAPVTSPMSTADRHTVEEGCHCDVAAGESSFLGSYHRLPPMVLELGKFQSPDRGCVWLLFVCSDEGQERPPPPPLGGG
ncbi:unnamed protein product [Lactuca saligna]|uniref:Uncharacterized protein n=1 Tax=Lactuca saligna TaxID=75948 RepID=A0AA35Z8L4_LACSI|nr:unnamed protein product [Lactuca saligna]